MYKWMLCILTASLMLVSCSKKSETWTVASQLGDCIGISPMKCLMIKKQNQNDWEFFYDHIQGFQYEPGYEYVIEVESTDNPNPAADASTLQYKLIKVVTKVQKQSENLPKVPVEDFDEEIDVFSSDTIPDALD